MRLVQPWTIGPISFVLSTVIRCWLCTLRFRFEFDDPSVDPRSCAIKGVYIFWHEGMLFPAYSHAHRGFSVLISQHRDGELIARILKHLGIDSVRGSTTRNGLSALRGLMREGKVSHLAITPDGPQGPRRIIQPGAIYLASRTGMPIVPAGFAFKKCWRAGSWDRMAFPKPFTVAMGVAGKPIYIPPDLSPEQIEEHRLIVQAAMDDVQNRAQTIIGAQDPQLNVPGKKSKRAQRKRRVTGEIRSKTTLPPEPESDEKTDLGV